MTPMRKETAWIIRMSRGLRRQAALNALLGITGVGLDFAFIYATKLTIDVATGPDSHATLWPYALLLLGITVAQVAMGFARRWMGSVLNTRAQNRMQRRVFERVLRNEWNGVQARHSGDTLNRLVRDVADITATITDTLPSLLTVLARFAGAFWFLFSMAPRLALLLCVVAPVFILLSRLYIRRMRQLSRQARDMDSRIQALMQESLQHGLVVKTLEHEGRTLHHLNEQQHSLLDIIRRRTLFGAGSGTLVNTGFAMGYLITFLWGAHGLQQHAITYGTMLAFIQLVGQIQGPFRDIIRFVPQLISTLTAAERLIELEQTPTEQTGQPIRFPRGAGIRLTDVSYTYPGGRRQILHDFSFDFPPGSRTAVIGETGAGKTTLVRLVLSIIRPQHGSVEFYDTQTTAAASPLTRCNLVYVPQGNTLFSGTVRSNLLMGDPTATEQQMREALHMACADFVLQMESGLDTPCGEGGTGLSEGQTQRISIARALLRRGNILLLDEATSALDSETEQQLVRNLNAFLQPHQTLICVTHRPSIRTLCSRTLRIER